MDVEGIAPGENFAETIDRTIASCRTVLVIIGPRWHQILEDRGKQSQEDYVRHEIGRALAREVTVIPVLVGGANASQLTGMPPELAGLPFHQAIDVRDASFKEDCERLVKALGGASPLSRWRIPLLLLAAAGVIGLVFWMFVSNNGLGERSKRAKAVAQLLATEETQTKLGEFEAAFRTASQAVNIDSTNRAALDRQVEAAMGWLENYSVVTNEGQSAAQVAGPQLAELINVLDGGLARTNGREPRAATILAHLGWAHWLNSNIAEKEFGQAPQQAFLRALSIEPTNVYANCMLGNWLLQNGGNLADAVQHFSVALATGNERLLVRTMQLGGMLYNDAPGVPREAVRVLNDMRKNHEPLDEAYRHRFLASDLDPSAGLAPLKMVLGGLPPEEAWQTYLWLDNAPLEDRDSNLRQMKRDFIGATLLELQGNHGGAQTAFLALQQKLKADHLTGSFADRVAEALSH